MEVVVDFFPAASPAEIFFRSASISSIEPYRSSGDFRRARSITFDKPRRDVPAQFRQRTGRLVENRIHDGGLVLPAERVHTGQHLEQDDTERKDVGTGVGLPALDLFGRHV